MTIIDARRLPDAYEVESDLCIIGAGAAGIAMASEFLNGPLRVALLESGGIQPDPEIQALTRGRMVGLPDFPLSQTRLRYFGGTTNHWSAHVLPLDPIDFERRSWVPHSGWPFGSSDLAPLYQRASQFLLLPERAFDARVWHGGGSPRSTVLRPSISLTGPA